MKIAIIGGGITGLTAAYELTKLGHTVTVLEKTDIPGGLAQGFTKPNWEWNLEAAYHHLFTSDTTILSLLNELGLSDDILTIRPVTATLYNEKSYQLDSPISLLTFPGLPFIDRIRTGILIAAMKLNPFWEPLEKKTAKEVFLPLGGKAGWRVIWEPLMVGKFGDYADTIAASWLWARIKKRTPSLVYIRGGFATFINRLVEKINKQGGKIHTEVTISSIQKNDVTGKSEILIGKKKETFDTVLLTVPTPIAVQMIPKLKNEYAKALTVPHLYAQVLILETKEPVLPNVYWLNITDRSFPFLAVVNHTHFIDRKHYGGNYITYIGNYLPEGHPYLKLTKEQLIKTFLPYLKKLNPSLTFSQLTTDNPQLYLGPFAQPIHQINYSQKAPKMKTSIPGVFLANMDSIYPWDRGVNYAVELGQTAVGKILTDKTE